MDWLWQTHQRSSEQKKNYRHKYEKEQSVHEKTTSELNLIKTHIGELKGFYIDVIDDIDKVLEFFQHSNHDNKTLESHIASLKKSRNQLVQFWINSMQQHDKSLRRSYEPQPITT